MDIYMDKVLDGFKESGPKMEMCSECGVVGVVGYLKPKYYVDFLLLKRPRPASLQKHHISYLPIRETLLCTKCHHSADKSKHQKRFARIFYSRKGWIEPANGDFQKSRPMTAREKMIRKYMMKSKKEPVFSIDDLFDWLLTSVNHPHKPG
jgi:hypothetical protein